MFGRRENPRHRFISPLSDTGFRSSASNKSGMLSRILLGTIIEFPQKLGFDVLASLSMATCVLAKAITPI
jgi:hypothetical protein